MLAPKNGKLALTSKLLLPSTNDSITSIPQSNSWLPIVKASNEARFKASITVAPKLK